MRHGRIWWGVLCAALLMVQPISAQAPQGSDTPKGHTYLPVVIEEDFATIMARAKQAKPEVMQRQRKLLEARYDLSDRPAAGVMMSGGRKAVQEGVRVKLPRG